LSLNRGNPKRARDHQETPLICAMAVDMRPQFGQRDGTHIDL
jgi:hypothetical protein